VPFNFLRRGAGAGGAGAGGAASQGVGRGPGDQGRVRPGRRIPFDGLTEEWRVVGYLDAEGRLSDALNRRAQLALSDARWAPIDGSAELEDAPGLKTIDPYDLVIVLAGEASLPPLSEDERAAHRIHKIEYDVALEVPPFRVIGTVFMHPGAEPERLLDRSTDMFIPEADAVATLDGRRVNAPEVDLILVNRSYLSSVLQVDRRTGERPQPLPGSPLGGTTWTDKSS
jgi:hypothetical protein